MGVDDHGADEPVDGGAVGEHADDMARAWPACYSFHVAEVSFRGVIEFSGESPVVAALSATGFPLYRLVITDDAVRVESRWRLLRSFLPSRRSGLDALASARLRGNLVLLYFPHDEWWSIWAGTKCTQILPELESRKIPVTCDE